MIPIKRPVLETLLVSVIMLLNPHLVAQQTSNLELSYVKWVLPVMYSQEVSKRISKVADDLAHSLGQEKAVPAKSNPVCAFWVQIDEWNANPGTAGYIVVIKQGGAWMRASNEEELQKAVDHVKKVILRKENGIFFLPADVILTNYNPPE